MATPWAVAALAVPVVLAAVLRRRVAVVVACAALAAGASGAVAAARDAARFDAALPSGPVDVAGRVASDPIDRWGEATVAIDLTHLQQDGRWRPWSGPRVSMAADEPLAAGDRVVVRGTLVAGAGRIGRVEVAGRLVAREVTRAGGPSDPLFAAGNLLRSRVHDGVAAFRTRPAAALLTGFLIGDVRDLPSADAEALRRTGLTHFVAVSGSNVALFLAAWWLALGPLGWSPRRRALAGFVGLLLFVVVTRWEPSVVRASVMASMVLGGVLAGIPVDGWTALGAAVAVVLAVSGGLATDVGFQLSVAATAGVLAGAGIWSHRRPRWAWTALGATTAAQAAVAPLLLVHFGSIPLLAPVANLLAAPLVAASTATGGIGVVTGLQPLTAVGVAAADGVLAVARALQDLPQLGWDGALGVGVVGLVALRRGLRPLVAIAAAGALAATVVLPGRLPGGPEMVVLDVGQGDAVLLRGPSGEVVLVDGGPDPAVLRRALVSRRIDTIGLLVVSHEHADHTTGLVGITGYARVERAWVSPFATGGPLDELLAELEAAGTPVDRPAAGWSATVGSFTLDVLGPLRRYASPNDGSLVILASASGATALLSGDIERIAQQELGTTHADILKVPHQGAATSDPGWLASVGASIAVISVGPNTYGHPSPSVVAVLEEAGADVRRTDRDGDVAVRFDAIAS